MIIFETMLHTLFSLLISFLWGIAHGQSVQIRNLNENWVFKQSTDSVWIKASVPGTVHTDLINNGIIEDPYYRLNERKVQWVDKKDWICQPTYNLDNQEFNRQNHELNIEG